MTTTTITYNDVAPNVKDAFLGIGDDVQLSNVVVHERQPSTDQHSTAIVLEGLFGRNYTTGSEWFSFITQMTVTYGNDEPLVTLISAHVTNSDGDPMIPSKRALDVHWPEEPASLEAICSSLADVCMAGAYGTPYQLQHKQERTM